MGTWSLIEQWIGSQDAIKCRLMLQMIHESAMCVNRLRPLNTLCNQGFAQVNGLDFLATDVTIHHLCDSITMQQTLTMQLALAKTRKALGHYHPAALLAIDPHRIISATQRISPKKKKRPEDKATKVLQDFFCNDAITGQPIVFLIASAGKSATSMAKQLIHFVEQLELLPTLFLADKEHYTLELFQVVRQHLQMEMIAPAIMSKKIKEQLPLMEYVEHWPGYATAIKEFSFEHSQQLFHLICQRTGLENVKPYFKAFIATCSDHHLAQINQLYPQRWSVEEFFNFEGDMAWNRASTFNLNIRYARQSAALIAQAACFELKRLLPQPYRQWTAKHLAQAIFQDFDGDIKVKGDTIIITFYNVPPELGLSNHFSDLPRKLAQQGYNPKVPWLYDFKVDFLFK